MIYHSGPDRAASPGGLRGSSAAVRTETRQWPSVGCSSSTGTDHLQGPGLARDQEPGFSGLPRAGIPDLGPWMEFRRPVTLAGKIITSLFSLTSK